MISTYGGNVFSKYVNELICFMRQKVVIMPTVSWHDLSINYLYRLVNMALNFQDQHTKNLQLAIGHHLTISNDSTAPLRHMSSIHSHWPEKIFCKCDESTAGLLQLVIFILFDHNTSTDDIVEPLAPGRIHNP